MRRLSEAQPGITALEYDVHQLGLLYGIQGLEVAISPGAGWGCTKTEGGILITADPTQLGEAGQARAASAREESEDIPAYDPRYLVLAISHEVGHARDYLDPDWHDQAGQSPAEKFFWNVVDDAAIMVRNRQVPLLDAGTDELYSRILFPAPDFRGQPKHVQLMLKALLDTVTPANPAAMVDQEIAALLASLSAYPASGRTFDVLQTLADPRTSLAQRRQIAEQFVLPFYQRLYDRDIEEARQLEKHEEPLLTRPVAPGKGPRFQAAYNRYDQAMHGKRKVEKQTKSVQEQGERKELAGRLAQLIEEDKGRKSPAPAKEPGDSGHHRDAPADTSNGLLERLVTSMQLAPGDAVRYIHSLSRLNPVIARIAEVYAGLAVPVAAESSLRYSRCVSQHGVRMHPGAMGVVALQLLTGHQSAVWQRPERRHLQEVAALTGLDVHLLVDVTKSMRGRRAVCAADTALCLLEGLELARHTAEQRLGALQRPDARIGILAFGPGTEVLSPLANKPTDRQKGMTYASLLRPDASSTNINGSLMQVKQAAQERPFRKSVVIVVSDCSFHDYDKAQQTVKSMPPSVSVTQLIVGNGEDAKRFKGASCRVIRDPEALPRHLYEVLSRAGEK